MNLSQGDIQRFWSKVNKNGPLPDQSNPHYAGLDPCWIWTGKKLRGGYGSFSVGKKFLISSRVSYFLENGSPPKDSPMICHKCDNPACCNPGHLFSGNHKNNSQDMAKKGRSPKGYDHKVRAKIDVSFDPSSGKARGERHGASVLTEKEVMEIRRLREHESLSFRELSEKFQIGISTASDIVRRKKWKHVA